MSGQFIISENDLNSFIKKEIDNRQIPEKEARIKWLKRSIWHIWQYPTGASGPIWSERSLSCHAADGKSTDMRPYVESITVSAAINELYQLENDLRKLKGLDMSQPSLIADQIKEIKDLIIKGRNIKINEMPGLSLIQRVDLKNKFKSELKRQENLGYKLAEEREARKAEKIIVAQEKVRITDTLKDLNRELSEINKLKEALTIKIGTL